MAACRVTAVPTTRRSCGQTHELIEAHHHDYSKPLDVEWLCPHCHARAHGRVKDLSHIEALQKQRGYM